MDKTGTITIGNRKATNFYPAKGVDEKSFIEAAVMSSLADETPEGKSIIELGKLNTSSFDIQNSTFIKFTAETKSSGLDMPNGTKVRKGAFDAIRNMVIKEGNPFPSETEQKVKEISSNGGTPLVVSRNNIALGVIELQDIINLASRNVLSA